MPSDCNRARHKWNGECSQRFFSDEGCSAGDARLSISGLRFVTCTALRGGRTLTAEVVFVDEFDRASAADEIVVFELDGVRYEIYLSRENATKLRDAFAAWIGAARQTATRQRRHLFSTTLDSAEAAAMRRAAIRQWAWTYGHGVAVHGRIPREVLKAYEAAHARKVRHTT